jgi:hypothetical protein
MKHTGPSSAATNGKYGAKTQKPLCTTAPRPMPKLSDTVLNDSQRAAAIVAVRRKWLNKTVLHYAFCNGASHWAVRSKQADAVRQAFAAWKAVGIGLEFTEVTDLSEAEVRVGFSTSYGRSESAVGRDVLNVPLDEPTTIYGWDLTTTYGRGTALHELGHVFGMEHEHQNPFAGIQWHEEAVYAALAGPPNNWPRQTTYFNILRKLDPQQVQGSEWDPNSIMEYEFEPGLIDVPEKYDLEGLVPPGKLSESDKVWALKWYPGAPTPAGLPQLEPFKAAAADLAAGQQIDFEFKPKQSRKYTIATQGACDTLLALFEEIDGEPRYLSADDDSGEDRNASIKYKLFKNRSYIVRLRLYYPGQTGTTSVLVT